MPKTIRVRYKDSSSNWPGDVASMNGYNIAGGFHGPKFPGYEEEIPGTFLDDTIEDKEYKNRDGSFDMVTEMEFKKRLFETGGFTRRPGQKFYQAAPPCIMANKGMLRIYAEPRKLVGQEWLDFLWKTKVATLLFKHFSPTCMEFIGPMPPDALELLKKKAKEPNAKTYTNLLSGPGMADPKPDSIEHGDDETEKAPDILKMDEVNAVKWAKGQTNVSILKQASAIESKKVPPRPRVAVAIEEQIKAISANKEI